MTRSVAVCALAVTVVPFAAHAQTQTNTVPPVTFRSGAWKWPTSAIGECEYHPIPSDSRALTLSIPASSLNLKPDRLGTYWEGNDTVRSYLGGGGTAYNFYSYWPETCTQPLPRKVRSLAFDLSSPHEGAKNRGLVRSLLAGMHVFPPQHGVAMKDIAVGQTISAQRVLFRFQEGNSIYYLRMGAEPFDGQGLPGYVELLPGQGTTVPQITRDSDNKWTISAKSGSLARLSIWGPKPVDLGLYQFSFEMELGVQRPVR
jgi:hypothetical protein